MNVFEYIAISKPSESFQYCQKYGIMEVEESELSEAIAHIVASEGENAFKELLTLHPDLEIILEVYQPKRPLQSFNGKQGEVLVPKPDVGVPIKIVGTENSNFQNSNLLAQKYFNAEGNSTGSKLVNQTNFFILAGALIVSLAIISAKK
jgi:hypothetical protein